MDKNGKPKRKGRDRFRKRDESEVGRVDRKQFALSALDEFERPLTRYAIRMYGTSAADSVEAARDAVQHTFLKLIQQDPVELAGKVGPWLYQVCRNRIIDQLRASRKTDFATVGWQADSLGAESVIASKADQRSGPMELAADKEILQRLQMLIGQMSGSDREVIELWSQGLSHQEVSKVLGKSPATVRVGLHRALNRLKQHPQVKNWLEHWQERATCQSAMSKSDRKNGKSKSCSPTEKV